MTHWMEFGIHMTVVTSDGSSDWSLSSEVSHSILFFLATIYSGTLDTSSRIINCIPHEGTGQVWWGGNLDSVG